ncbi:MAG: hypothetical protein U0169_00025 [Polyangiaceae bacterium]
MREKASVFALLSVSSLVTVFGCSSGADQTAFQKTVHDIAAMPVKVATVHIQADGGLGFPTGTSGTAGSGTTGTGLAGTAGSGSSSSSSSPFGSFGLGADTLPGLTKGADANAAGGANAGPNPSIAGGTQNSAGISGGTQNSAAVGGGAANPRASISGGTANSPGGGGAGGSVGSYITAVCRMMTAYCRNITSCISSITDKAGVGIGGSISEQASSQVAASCDTLADTCQTSISTSLQEASYVAIPASVVDAVNCIADKVEAISCDNYTSFGQDAFTDCNFTVPSDSSSMTSDSSSSSSTGN